MSSKELFSFVADYAAKYAATLEDRAVSPVATPEELRGALGGPAPTEGTEAKQVLSELISVCEPGLLHTAGPSFFGWVIGGATPASQAADWLATAWDQNAGGFACSPAVGVLEEVCGAWLLELLKLPSECSFALVTGCQMAHVTGLAAARYRLLERRGWDVGTQGLCGAPPIRVLSGEHHHETFARALRLLGLGTSIVERLPLDQRGGLSAVALRDALTAQPELGPATIVCLQAGDLNTGTCDDFETLCDIAHEHNAWVHVDGAFGHWAQVSDVLSPQLRGIEKADSWATDGHKWLNVPYESGYAFVRDAEAHRRSMAMDAHYLIEGQGREANAHNPEWSKRARALPTYAAIRSLGRKGIAEIVERCTQMCQRLVRGLGELEGVEVLHEPTLNQGLVRFLAGDGDHDRKTDAIADALQVDGKAWFGNTEWQGKRVMRVSVCNWQTEERHIDRAIERVRLIVERFDSP